MALQIRCVALSIYWLKSQSIVMNKLMDWWLSRRYGCSSVLFNFISMFLCAGDFLREPHVYEDLTDMKSLKSFMETHLEDYNLTPGVVPMSLVLFRDAIEHGAAGYPLTHITHTHLNGQHIWKPQHEIQPQSVWKYKLLLITRHWSLHLPPISTPLMGLCVSVLFADHLVYYIVVCEIRDVHVCRNLHVHWIQSVVWLFLSMCFPSSVIRVVRVISQPRGNMLLVGIGGSGRQSLSRMAASICEYQIFQVEVTKLYRKQEFREGEITHGAITLVS